MSNIYVINSSVRSAHSNAYLYGLGRDKTIVLYDSLLKSLNNPAVQGVVAVSDKEQLERIKKHAADVKDLRDKLKYWDYEEVIKVHESLEYTNEVINALKLVPQSF